MSRVLVVAGIVWKEMLRRKDFYVLLVLLVALTLSLLTIQTFGADNIARYVLDLGLLMIWLFSIILAVTLTARQIPEEERCGTIYSLLAKPVSRMELVIGKWFGCWAASVAAAFIFFIFLIAVILLRGGTVNLLALLQCLSLYGALLGVVTAITMALSVRLSYGAAATTSFVLQGSIFLIVPRIPVLIGYEQGLRKTLLLGIYYLLPHYELFDMRRRLVHEWGVVPWSTFALVLSYGLVLSILFILIAWAGYRKKHFKRGEAI